MKIVQGRRGFAPITITLETEEEASGLWHILACLDDESLSDYLEGKDPKAKEIILRMSYTMFHEYDDIYNPGVV